MILLRTTRVDTTIEALADELEHASGETVALLVDERDGAACAAGRLKVSMTYPGCAAQRLYAPSNFTWKCGDYGFYLARAQFPDQTHFWMIEYDVRISGDAASFFAAWRQLPDIDLVAAYIGPAERDWWWRATVTSADAAPRRCFFPVVRLSVRAIDVLAAKRRAHSRRPLRRALWANDESFVATAIAAAAMTVADLNDTGRCFYDDKTYSYTNMIDGAHFSPDGFRPQLHHPVLFGNDLVRKQERLRIDDGRPKPFAERVYRKLVSLANGVTKW